MATRKKAARNPVKQGQKAAGGAGGAGGATGLRIRMYRVGFGDFFLLSVPVAGSYEHVLIDCGVHAKDVHSIAAAVAHMAQETGKQLALIIVTHRHADHVTGFSKCKELFAQFKVERIWMSWYENPQDQRALAIQARVAAMASEVQRSLAASGDDSSDEYRMAANLTEVTGGAGGSQNPQAFQVLRSFPGNPPIDYYKAGDVPLLPQSLLAAGLSAQILGPPTDPTIITKTDKSSEEYVASQVAVDAGPIQPFASPFRIRPESYTNRAFGYITRGEIEARVAQVQPNMRVAKANAANNVINNQSLVTLFTYKGKTLLFAGDAQWGNWANFLYGNVNSTTLQPAAAQILANLDFYKVGHHGSTNATPKSALAAMRAGCVAMCSTATGAYNQVPRPALIAAIDERTREQLARSDQVAAGDAPADAQAGGPPPAIFKAITTADQCGYIDYTF